MQLKIVLKFFFKLLNCWINNFCMVLVYFPNELTIIWDYNVGLYFKGHDHLKNLSMNLNRFKGII